jgi:hypothetical protein
VIWAKACQRCGRGDLVRDSDVWGDFRYCLQCGWAEEMVPQQRPWDPDRLRAKGSKRPRLPRGPAKDKATTASVRLLG